MLRSGGEQRQAPYTYPLILGALSCQVYKKWSFHSTPELYSIREHKIVKAGLFLCPFQSQASLQKMAWPPLTPLAPQRGCWGLRLGQPVSVGTTLSGIQLLQEGAWGWEAQVSIFRAQDPTLGPFKGGTVRGEYDIPGTGQGIWVACGLHLSALVLGTEWPWEQSCLQSPPWPLLTLASPIPGSPRVRPRAGPPFLFPFW